jgi:biotin synthase
MSLRHDWKTTEIMMWLTSPLAELLEHAREIHAELADKDIQCCELMSIKTGACPEDCGYCSQSAHFKTQVTVEPLISVEEVAARAAAAKKHGASRFCLGAAWREVPGDARFDRVLSMIRAIARTGLEVCCTMGFVTDDQLTRMKSAGLTAYNHNIDTGREYYPNLVSTHVYEDRLKTLARVRAAGIQVCTGGILGLGETMEDRAAMLMELARMSPHPESVPINLLVPVEGTPLEENEAVPFEILLRVIATARILMPRSRVRLSAGRNSLTADQQLQCFRAGANSIFIGEKLLTTPNLDGNFDSHLLERFSQDEICATD